MVDKNGAAYLAASFATHESVPAVAADYLTWLNAQVTIETAINSLLAAANASKDPEQVLVHAGSFYAQFENDPPTVGTVTPNGGTTAGGTAVSLVGTNFNGATAVTFGGTAATSVVVVDDKHITCVSPAKTAGAATVAVTTPAGSGSKANAFTYA